MRYLSLIFFMKKFLLGLGFGIVIVSIPVVFAGIYFTDVPDNTWYSSAIRSLLEKHIISNVNNQNYYPDRNVNRAELSVLLNNTVKSLVKGTPSLLEGHHLLLYSVRFYDALIPPMQDSNDSPIDIEAYEKAFTFQNPQYGALSVYSSNGWRNRRLSVFYIHKDSDPMNERWYGPFVDDVSRLSREVQELANFYSGPQ